MMFRDSRRTIDADTATLTTGFRAQKNPPNGRPSCIANPCFRPTEPLSRLPFWGVGGDSPWPFEFVVKKKVYHMLFSLLITKKQAYLPVRPAVPSELGNLVGNIIGNLVFATDTTEFHHCTLRQISLGQIIPWLLVRVQPGPLEKNSINAVIQRFTNFLLDREMRRNTKRCVDLTAKVGNIGRHGRATKTPRKPSRTQKASKG